MIIFVQKIIFKIRRRRGLYPLPDEVLWWEVGEDREGELDGEVSQNVEWEGEAVASEGGLAGEGGKEDERRLLPALF